MGVLEKQNARCFDGLLDEIIDAILRPPAASVHVIRAWLLELFVRGTVLIPASKVRRLEVLTHAIDRRQLLLIRGRCKDINFFRKQKTAFQSFSPAEMPCLLWGASCLPKDEYETWLQSLRGIVNRPTFGLYLNWLKDQRVRTTEKLSRPVEEHI
jgi:hypothetical protein